MHATWKGCANRGRAVFRKPVVLKPQRDLQAMDELYVPEAIGQEAALVASPTTFETPSRSMKAEKVPLLKVIWL